MGATPPESPSTEKNAANERVTPIFTITEEMIEGFIKKNGEKELHDILEYAKDYLNDGQDEQVAAALWHTMRFYEPKGGPF